jgi:Homeodomain-like domain-containing protein
VLVELGVVEQRYRAVLEVLEDGAPVTEVARRYGVARQTVHEWLAPSPPAGNSSDRYQLPCPRCPRRGHLLPSRLPVTGSRHPHQL